MNNIKTKVEEELPINKREIIQYTTLTFSGGYVGAFSYAMCDNMFANAQTGNLINLMLAVKTGNIAIVCLHLLPFVMYVVGISCTIILPLYLQRHSIQWENICLLMEATCMGIVGVMPSGISPVIYLTPLFFASALQYNTFKSCNGVSVSTLFCTNNIRQMIVSFWKYRLEKDQTELFKLKIYCFILLTFLLGALSCFMLVNRWNQFAVLVPGVILIGNGFVFERRLMKKLDCV